MSMSVDGLVSGMDTTSIISQLMATEAAPQNALKTKLTTTQSTASAYRTVNTTILAITAAADALTSSTLTSARKASTGGSTAVTASASTTASPGSAISFSVTSLVSTQSLVTNSEWNSLKTDATAQEPSWPIEIQNVDGTVRGTVSVAAGASLNDAIAAINSANLGVKASAITLGPNRYGPDPRGWRSPEHYAEERSRGRAT